LRIEKRSNVITYAISNMISCLDRDQVEESIKEQLNSKMGYIVQKKNELSENPLRRSRGFIFLPECQLKTK
jgi:hypothetical protein